MLEESTTEVDRFVHDEAVVRIRFAGDGSGDAEGGAEEEGKQEGGPVEGTVPRLDENHLRNVLEKVTAHAFLLHCRPEIYGKLPFPSFPL